MNTYTMTSTPRKNHIMFPASSYYQIRNKRFASARSLEYGNKGKSALVFLIALVLLGVGLGVISESPIMGPLKSAFDDPSLRAYANEQGDGSDSLIVSPESRSS